MQDDSDMTPRDLERINELTKRYEERRLDAQQAFLDELRELIGADYVCRAVAQFNTKTYQVAVIELDDSADICMTRLENPWRQWLSVGMKLNIDPQVGRMFSEISKDEPLIAFRLADFKRPKIRLDLKDIFEKAYSLTLLAKWHAAGLKDEMYVCYRYPSDTDIVIGSIIGFHRRKERRSFSMRDLKMAVLIRERNRWIHSIGVNTEFDATVLLPQYRELLPLLLHQFTVTELGEILGRSSRTIEKQIAAIAREMKLEHETRDAIREHYRLRPTPPLGEKDALKELEDGLRSLLTDDAPSKPGDEISENEDDPETDDDSKNPDDHPKKK